MSSSALSFLESTQSGAKLDKIQVEELDQILKNSKPEKIDDEQCHQCVVTLSSWIRNHEDWLLKSITDNLQDKIHLLIISICRFFSGILNRNKDADLLALNRGIVGCLAKWLEGMLQLRNPFPKERLQSVIELLTCLSRIRESDKIFQTANVVKLLLQILQIDSNQRTNPPIVALEVLDDSITSLALMMSRSRHKRMLCQNHGIPLVIYILKLYADQPDIIVACGRFLSNFQDKSEYREIVFNHGGHLALQSAFSAAPVQVKKNFESSPYGSNDQKSHTEVLALQEKQILSIRMSCVEALWQTCIDNDKAVEAIYMSAFFDTNLPPCLEEYLSYLASFPQDTNNIASVLDDLAARGSSPTDEKAMFPADMSPPPSRAGSGGPGSAGPSERLVYRLGTDEAFRKEIERLFEASFGILRRVAKNQTCRQICVALPYLEMASHSLKLFKPDASNYGLAREVCGMIGNLSIDPEWRKDVVQMGFVPAIIDLCMASKLEETRKLMKIAFSCLANLAHDAQSRQAMIDVLPIINEVILINYGNEMIIESAVVLLSHLAPDEHVVDCFRLQGVPEVLMCLLNEVEDVAVSKRILVTVHRIIQADRNERVFETLRSGGVVGSMKGCQAVLSCFEKNYYDEGVTREVSWLVPAMRIPEALVMQASQDGDVFVKAFKLFHHDAEITRRLGDIISNLPLTDDTINKMI